MYCISFVCRLELERSILLVLSSNYMYKGFGLLRFFHNLNSCESLSLNFRFIMAPSREIEVDKIFLKRGEVDDIYFVLMVMIY